MFVTLTDKAIDLNQALTYVRHPSCGAVSMFEGNIRNENEGMQVLNLEYEVYEALFYNEVSQLVEECNGLWQIHDIAVIQRVGLLLVGECGIVICVSAAHRRDSLDALSYMIEEFKKRAPVWKKELTSKGEKWVNWPVK